VNLPPRKPVTAWETNWNYGEEDVPFVVLTFHHGLGKMTRLDLSTEDVRDLVAHLNQTLENREENDDH
jgi:hypothetical protein